MKEVPRDKVSTTKEASSKKQNRKLVGKYIKHKCNHSWLNAKVIRLIGTEVCDDSDFEVEYEGFSGLYNKKLIADLKNNLIVVVGSVSAIDKRKHLLNMGEESEECDDGPEGAKRKRGRGKGQQKGQAKKRGKGKKESEKRQDEELVRRSGRKRKLVDYTKMSGDDHDTDNATDNVDVVLKDQVEDQLFLESILGTNGQLVMIVAMIRMYGIQDVWWEFWMMMNMLRIVNSKLVTM